MATRKLARTALSAAAQALSKTHTVEPGTMPADAASEQFKQATIPAALANSEQFKETQAVFKTANQKLAENPNFKPADAKAANAHKDTRPKGAPRSVANVAAVVQIGPKIIEGKKAQRAGSIAKGKALAETVWQHAAKEAVSWRTYYESLFDLDQSGHRAFRAELVGARTNARAVDKEVTATAMVRISQILGFSRAAEAGFTKAAAREIWLKLHGVEADWNQMHVGVILRCAKVYMDTRAQESVDGATVQRTRGRGRTAKPAMDKVRDFILKTLSPKQFAELEKMVHRMAETIKTPKQAARELEAQKKEVKEDRRNVERLAA